MRVKFEAQLERLNVELITMGALCEEVISGAAKALLDGIKAEWDGGERAVLQRAERYALLALDDLGMERPTEWAMETLSRLIDSRTMEGLPTIITSNYSLGELRDRWGGMEGARIVSRIAGSCERVEMTGRDRRMR